MDSIDHSGSMAEIPMDITASNEEILVIVQTETGEQIALPMSALPNDFVPGDSGQIIMLEGGLDEQPQEIVVESSDLTEPQTSSNDLVSLQHVDPGIHLPASEYIVESQEEYVPPSNETSNHTEVLSTSVPTITFGDRLVAPRTYSKNNSVKSYAPTCGPARIYQQCQPVLDQQQQEQLHLQIENFQVPSSVTHPSDDVSETQTDQNDSTTAVQVIREPEKLSERPVVVVPRCKQKRKEPLLLRPINDNDIEFLVVREASPPVHEVEVRRRRRDHRTKRIKAKLEKASATKTRAQAERDLPNQEGDVSQDDDEDEQGTLQTDKPDPEAESAQEESERQLESKARQPKPARRSQTPKQEKVQSQEIQQPEQQQQQQQQGQQHQVERRTRLSNTCRVATGKNYRCNDCDFSTDRINNIVLHVRENCPNLKKA